MHASQHEHTTQVFIIGEEYGEESKVAEKGQTTQVFFQSLESEGHIIMKLTQPSFPLHRILIIHI